MATATLTNPIYYVTIQHGTKKYGVSPILMDLTLTESSAGIAQVATFTIANVKIEGAYASSIFTDHDRVYITASTGEKKGEVFRGWIWKRSKKSSDEKTLEFKCYDNLIYLQQSEDYIYYNKGKSTSAICKNICKDWGIKLSYGYQSIKHEKLALRGTLSDILLADILEPVRKKTGKKYIVRCDKGVTYINNVGTNKTIYKLLAKQNVIDVATESTLENLVTKVIIVSTDDEKKKAPISATVKGNTKTYGTLQRIINKSSNTTLADAKKEANEEIKEHGKPQRYYALRAIDNPWVRKGDKVYIEAGGLNGYYIVTDINHDITVKSKTMSLEVEKA